MSIIQKVFAVVFIFGVLLAFRWGDKATEVTPIKDVGPFTETEQSATVLVELFTSQGCSSCPPADRVLESLVADTEQGELKVIALSYHVDYWNRLGWKDPYSQAAFSDRQRDYAQRLPEHRVYTPQMVIQGQSSHVGSREKEVREAIRQASQQVARAQITASLQEIATDNATKKIQYQLSGSIKGVILQLALVAPSVGNDVPRGENGGRYLEHCQVVLDLQTHKVLAAEGIISVDTKILDEQPSGKIILFLQDAKSWEVMGTTEIVVPPSE